MYPPIDTLPTPPPIPPIRITTLVEQATAQAAQALDDTNGGYVFSLEEVEEVIDQWKKLLAEIEEDIPKAETVANVQAPGEEYASSRFRDAAVPSGQMLHEQAIRMRDYVQEYIRTLEEAKRATLEQDETGAEHIASAGRLRA